MCISDLRLGRFVTSNTTFVTSTAGAQVLTQKHPQRIGIMFGPVSSGGLNTVAADDGSGFIPICFLQGFAIQPILFSLETHGKMPTYSWRLEAGVAGNTYSVTEFFLPEKVLAESIESLERDYPGISRL